MRSNESKVEKPISNPKNCYIFSAKPYFVSNYVKTMAESGITKSVSSGPVVSPIMTVCVSQPVKVESGLNTNCKPLIFRVDSSLHLVI